MGRYMLELLIDDRVRIQNRLNADARWRLEKQENGDGEVENIENLKILISK